MPATTAGRSATGAISERNRNEFLRGLESLATGGAAIVIAACRNDFYSNVAREPSNSGDLDLEKPGRTVIIYQLLEQCRGSYQLLHVNLDPGRCATSQIESVCVDHDANKIPVIDRNDGGATGDTPFSLRGWWHE